MHDWKAHVYSDPFGDPLAQSVTLLLARRVPGGGEYVGKDNLLHSIPEGSDIDRDSAIRLPADAIPAIAAAIERWQGKSTNAQAENAVLREWLTVERGRVDKALDR